MYAEDDYRKEGKFVLTSSMCGWTNAAGFRDERDFSSIMKRPLTLYETGESNGEISFQELFDGYRVEGIASLTLKELAFAIVRGGWPEAMMLSDRLAPSVAQDYIKWLILEEVSFVDGIQKSPHKVLALLHSLALHISTTTTLKTLREDIAASGDLKSHLSEKTISQYIRALDQLFVTYQMPAWTPALTNKSVIRTSPIRNFTDPSLAAAVVGFNYEYLHEDFLYFEALVKAVCVRDLRIYAEALGGQIYHYKDKSGLEIDAIIVLPDGRWGAVTTMLGGKAFNQGTANLLKFKERVDTTKMGEPAFLMLLTNTDFGYRQKEGVTIVPIGCLKD